MNATAGAGDAEDWLRAWEARLSQWAADGDPDPAAVAAIDPGSARFDRGQSPRPIMLHLAVAGALAGRASLEAAGLAPDLTESLARPERAVAPPDTPPDLERGVEVGVAALRRISAMLEGIDAYRRHPWRRPPEAAPVVWELGSSRLLDYAPEGNGRPVLFVPSLVNDFRVLDLLPERSLLRWFAARGVRPLLLDWGCPGPAESRFGIGDYLERRLLPALSAAARTGDADLVGYCMGGHFVLAASQRLPARVGRIALVATPWDFAAGNGAGAALRGLARGMGDDGARRLVRQMGRCFGCVPVDFLQAVFALLDPNLALRKFGAFRDLPADGLAARTFVATEDWLNDGRPLAPRAGEELLIDWCLENGPSRGAWQPGGMPVLPSRTACDAVVVASRTDRIAPIGSVRPLARQIPGARWLEIDAGHIGMMVGSRAAALMWEPLFAWLTER